MESNNNGKFFIGSLVAIALVVLVVLGVMGATDQFTATAVSPDMSDDAVAERLKPVANVHIGEEKMAEASGGEEMASGEDGGIGQQIVNSACIACHGNGTLNAPILGNAEQWAPRIEKGMETLYDHAINGFKNMPARGGRASLSDEEVKAAVDYMVAQSE